MRDERKQERKELRRSRSAIRDEIHRIVIDIDIAYNLIDRLEYEDLPEDVRSERRDELLSEIDAWEELREEKWAEEGRLSRAIERWDRGVHRVLNDLERTLVHELLHGAGFKHSRDESFIMSESMCIAGYGECTADIKVAHRDEIFNSFACMQNYLGWNSLLDKVYGRKAARVRRNAHEDTTKREDWERTLRFDERAISALDWGPVWNSVMSNFDSRVKVR